MKCALLTIVTLAVGLSGCADWTGADAGNPNRAAYAGEAGSVYSTAANPPKTVGMVNYDPNATPAPTSDMPTPGPGSAPLPPYNTPMSNGTPLSQPTRPMH
ncbi:MAG TPA: hypothetical protein VHV26_11520 [Rhizomicrobium sp.]|jgi:hypothetical protein|nr:hypothetical protein [Rhizomicrobium sp.]